MAMDRAGVVPYFAFQRPWHYFFLAAFKIASMNHAHSHHNHNHADMETDMRRRFWISLLLSIPITLYSPLGLNYFKFNLPSPIPVNWLLFILTTPIVFWTGSIFITGTYYSLKARKLHMSVL